MSRESYFKSIANYKQLMELYLQAAQTSEQKAMMLGVTQPFKLIIELLEKMIVHNIPDTTDVFINRNWAHFYDNERLIFVISWEFEETMRNESQFEKIVRNNEYRVSLLMWRAFGKLGEIVDIKKYSKGKRLETIRLEIADVLEIMEDYIENRKKIFG